MSSRQKLIDFITEQKWFQDMVEQRAMEMLDDLLSDDNNPDEVIPAEIPKLSWHYSGGVKDKDGSLVATGPNEELLTVSKSRPRGTNFFFWDGYVNGLQVASDLRTMRDAKDAVARHIA